MFDVEICQCWMLRCATVGLVDLLFGLLYLVIIMLLCYCVFYYGSVLGGSINCINLFPLCVVGNLVGIWCWSDLVELVHSTCLYDKAIFSISHVWVFLHCHVWMFC